jgi:hypothetical protein
MKKKSLFVFSALALLLLLTPSFALASNQQNYFASLSEEKLAYQNLDAAPTEWKDDILAARNSIIYSNS